MRRIAEYQPPTEIHDVWRRFLEGMDYPEELVGPLLDPDTLVDACDALPIGMARQFHACTHTTFAPTIVHGGTKINVIPDRVDLQIDIRTLPGPRRRPRCGRCSTRRSATWRRRWSSSPSHDDPSTASPIDTPLWDSLEPGHPGVLRGLERSCRS